ncbi:hypothetical protein TVAG_190160 [Trichomonas vaginalis G3]|uniref:VWFA domain-containing protein n=1 Tax=Trichomonas vaginalis (strain ATCC PRA-98 / G3) TaxID=412133 RepID=A2DKE5_TRIV3|nr:hypothetical protein TVAG_190160 [Trichomonas vaginalis G3]|eukprot:XP_001580108.1 hypothetical protein [Trichomonas vaginalis G3]
MLSKFERKFNWKLNFRKMNEYPHGFIATREAIKRIDGIRSFTDVDKSKVQYNTFSSGQDIDICFVVDGTKSMNNERGKVHEFEEKANERSMITGAKSIFKKLMEYTKKKYSDLNVRYSANFFRDAAMAEQLYRHKKQGHGTVDYNVATPFDFKEHGGSINPVEFDKVETKGGAGDGPEDWVQAFEGMFKFHWKPQAKKIMIMITDAGGHGEKFNSKPDRDDEDKEIDRTEGPKVERLIRRIAEEKIDVCFIYTHWNAKQGMKEFKRIYEEAGGSNFKSIEETFANAGQELRQTVSDLITSIVDTAVASFNTSKVKEITLAADAKLPKRKKREQISLEINDQPKSIPNEKSGRKKERVVSGVVEYEEKSQESTPVEVVSETQTTEEGLNKFKDEINSHRNDIKAIEQKVKEQKMTRMINMESIPPAPANIQTANQYFVQSNQQQQGMQGIQMPPQQQQQQGMQMPPQQQQQGMQMLPQQQQQGIQMPPQQQQQGIQMPPQQQQQGMQMPPPQQQQQEMQMPPL